VTPTPVPELLDPTLRRAAEGGKNQICLELATFYRFYKVGWNTVVEAEAAVLKDATKTFAARGAEAAALINGIRMTLITGIVIQEGTHEIVVESMAGIIVEITTNIMTCKLYLHLCRIK